MRDLNQLPRKANSKKARVLITRKAIVLAAGAIFLANLLVLSAVPARADGDKKDDGGKKIIIVVGPVTKTHDKKH